MRLIKEEEGHLEILSVTAVLHDQDGMCRIQTITFAPTLRSPINISTFGLSLQSFFGFGQSADIEIELTNSASRKQVDVKNEDGKKEKLFQYYDGESVSGKV